METSTIAIIISIATIIMYVTEIIPLSMTAMISCLTMGIFGVSTFSRAFAGFSNDILMMVVGMLVVGDTLFATGAAEYLGGKIVKRFGKTEKMFIGASILISAFLSAFLSNTATAAMMFPIMAATITSSKGKLTKKNTYMSIGFASIAGGGCTLIGSTPQLLAQGILQEGGFELVGFFEYAWAGIPKVFILLIYYLTIGYSLGKKVYDFDELPNKVSTTGFDNDKLTPKMIISIAILFGCVIGFISGLWTLGAVSMVGAVLCVITKCIDIKDMYRDLDWVTIVIVGGSLGFANCLDDSGAGIIIAEFVVGLLGENASPHMIISILGLVAVILGNIMTHTATAAILIPISVYIAQTIGIDVKSMVMSIVIFTNVTYATPIMTPAATLSLAAGYRFKDYIKVGGLLNVISYIAVVLMIPLLFEL
jgi:sodium-dependent dicarboxylate transporter 2/3/5